MSARVLDPAALASSFRAELRKAVAELSEPLTLAGFLVEGHGPSLTYADYTRRGCEDVGIKFDLRMHEPRDMERAVRMAGADPSVHGMLIYYPVAGLEPDRWLRELVDPRKDVEGLHSFWARCLYENRRFVDNTNTKRAILPCTPLAALKLLHDAGVGDPGAKAPLAGLKVVVFNRSEVVGYPLAAMMANDGAQVVSFDIDGPLLFAPSDGMHDVHATAITRKEALAEADVVITGVPSRAFELVRASELNPGVTCLNFSTLKNFADDVLDVAEAFVPRVGPMTVTMAMRNALRLYQNFGR